MTIVSKALIPAKAAENVQTTQYTATNCTAVIDKFTATNITTTNATISVNIVASGGSPGNGNLIIKTRQIAPGESYTCPALTGHVVPDGSIISTIAGTASAITIACSGREITANV